METSLKRLCLVITFFIFTEISNEQQTTIPNSKVLRNREKLLNGSTESLRELPSVRDGGASIKGHTGKHLQGLNSNLGITETTIKGQAIQPKPDGTTVRNGSSMIHVTGGGSQSDQDRRNLTNGPVEINSLLKHINGANSITGGKKMFIVNDKSSFNGGLWQSKQELRKLNDEQASLRKGEKMINRQTTRRKQAKMMLGKVESK